MGQAILPAAAFQAARSDQARRRLKTSGSQDWLPHFSEVLLWAMALTLGLAYRKYAMARLSEITVGNFGERLSQFAKEHGADPVKAVEALSDARLAALVEEDYQEGVGRGIANAPTVLVNGRPFIETFAFEDVAKAIEAELAATK